MDQLTFGDSEFASKKKRTRREIFLEEMEQIVPWSRLLNLIEPHYPVAGRGRHPYAMKTMLRIHLMQNWFGLSDPAMEEALYEIGSMRSFACLSLTRPIPDETTILNFRRLIERHDLAEQIFAEINAYLSRKGLLLKRGTIVDATIIAAPSSTKNAEGERDPEMHRTKKGNQWFFGMKAHIGVDQDSGLVHTVVTTPANTADVEVVADLLHGRKKIVHGHSGYLGAPSRVDDEKLKWSIVQRRDKLKAMEDSRKKERLLAAERRKARLRARVEHPFRVVKRPFGYVKVRFRGLAKNMVQILTLFALSNLWMARRQLQTLAGKLRPQHA